VNGLKKNMAELPMLPQPPYIPPFFNPYFPNLNQEHPTPPYISGSSVPHRIYPPSYLPPPSSSSLTSSSSPATPYVNDWVSTMNILDGETGFWHKWKRDKQNESPSINSGDSGELTSSSSSSCEGLIKSPSSDSLATKSSESSTLDKSSIVIGPSPTQYMSLAFLTRGYTQMPPKTAAVGWCGETTVVLNPTRFIDQTPRVKLDVGTSTITEQQYSISTFSAPSLTVVVEPSPFFKMPLSPFTVSLCLECLNDLLVDIFDYVRKVKINADIEEGKLRMKYVCFLMFLKIFFFFCFFFVVRYRIYKVIIHYVHYLLWLVVL
jgi:hypothetical protein